MAAPTLPRSSVLPSRPAPAHRSAPGRGGYWIGGATIGTALAAAVVWVALGWLALMHHVDGFPRMSAPGRTTIHVSADTKRVFYSEHASGIADVTAIDIAVAGPSGRSMPVGADAYDFRYDVPGEPGRVGRAVATFRSTVAGNYTVTVTGAAPGTTVAIGDDVVRDAVPHVIGAAALLFVGVGAGVAMVGVTAVRRRGSGRTDR